ncbi:unnamed protein product [Ectocarpus sp. 12 AP-2014]
MPARRSSMPAVAATGTLELPGPVDLLCCGSSSPPFCSSPMAAVRRSWAAGRSAAERGDRSGVAPLSAASCPPLTAPSSTSSVSTPTSDTAGAAAAATTELSVLARLAPSSTVAPANATALSSSASLAVSLVASLPAGASPLAASATASGTIGGASDGVSTALLAFETFVSVPSGGSHDVSPVSVFQKYTRPALSMHCCQPVGSVYVTLSAGDGFGVETDDADAGCCAGGSSSSESDP